MSESGVLTANGHVAVPSASSASKVQCRDKKASTGPIWESVHGIRGLLSEL